MAQLSVIVIPSRLQPLFQTEYKCYAGWISGFSSDQATTLFVTSVRWDEAALGLDEDQAWQCAEHSASKPETDVVRFHVCDTSSVRTNEKISLRQLPESVMRDCCAAPEGRAFLLSDSESSEASLVSVWIRVIEEDAFISHVTVDCLSFGNTQQIATMKRSGARVEALANKKVVIVGSGSGGSEIAIQLAAMGVGSLYLVDPDRMEARNYSLHTAGRFYAGRPKVLAVKEYINNHLLDVEVRTWQINIVNEADLFRALLYSYEPDLIVCATDSVQSQRFANYCSIAFAIPLVVACIIGSGDYGRVIRVRPRVGPCFDCVRYAMGPSMEEYDDDDIHGYYGFNSSSPPIVYRYQVTNIAVIAVRTCLGIMAPSVFPSLPADLMLWCCEPIIDMPAPFDSLLPFTLKYIPVEKWGNCDVCGQEQIEKGNENDRLRANAIISGNNNLQQ